MTPQTNRKRRTEDNGVLVPLRKGYTGPRHLMGHALALMPDGMPLGEWLTSVIPEGVWADMEDDELAALILGRALVVAIEGWEDE